MAKPQFDRVAAPALRLAPATALAPPRAGDQLEGMPLSTTDREALAAAVDRLERPGLAGRMARLAGKPAEALAIALPAGASAIVAKAAGRALERALEVALFSLRDARLGGGRALHSGLACASGALGGAFGLAALSVELPVSTTIMLRAVAAVARDEGEDLADPRTALACLEVFALGGAGADGVEAGYFATRALLARGLVEAADFAVGKGAVKTASPVVARFLAPIAARFGAVVSEKLAAQAVMVVGAVGGAAVNLAFAEHFQGLARGHFTVRRLERAFGAEIVRAEYERLKSAADATR